MKAFRVSQVLVVASVFLGIDFMMRETTLLLVPRYESHAGHSFGLLPMAIFETVPRGFFAITALLVAILVDTGVRKRKWNWHSVVIVEIAAWLFVGAVLLAFGVFAAAFHIDGKIG